MPDASEINDIVQIYHLYENFQQFAAAYPGEMLPQESLPTLLEQTALDGSEYVIQLANRESLFTAQAYVQQQLPAAGQYSVDASQAIQEYEQSGQNLTGGIPPVFTNPGVAVAGGGGFTLAGLLGVLADAVACGLVFVGGYVVGRGIQNSNPELWEDIFQTILPWTFDIVDHFVPVVDHDGKTYVDKRLYDAIRARIDEWGKGGTIAVPGVQDDVQIDYSSEGMTITGGAEIRTYYGDTFYTHRIGPDSFSGEGFLLLYGIYGTGIPYWHLIRAASSSSALSGGSSNLRDHTKNGKTVYYKIDGGNQSGSASSISVISSTFETQRLDSNSQDWEVAWNMIYDVTATPLPTGVTVSPVGPVSDPTSGAIEVVTDNEGHTTTYIPFSLPGYNDDEIDPAINPNPQQYTNPSSQVQRYGQNSPLPSLSPTIDTTSNPETNPSSQPETQPQTITPTPTKTPDSGQSPTNTPNTTPPVFDPGSSNPSGLINVYNPTPQELYAFGRWLWVTYTDITIEKILNNPFDGVISLHEIYATPNRGARQVIRSGFLSSPADALTVPNRYSYINCGSVVIPEWYGNYLDYSPYTKVFIYLPFIGIEEIDADDVIGAAVNVTYGVDSYSGACVAIITTAREGYNSTTYQFTGNCAVEHPMSGGTQAQNLIAILQGALGTATSFFTSDFSGLVSSALDVTKSKSTVSHSGKFGANFGAMACKKPYLIVKRPNQVIVPNYNEFYGYPAHKYVVIGSCTGYLRCKEVHVNSARATDEEKARIEELLKAGVYVS